LRMGTAARAAVEGRTWDGVNDLLVRHYREVVAAEGLVGGGEGRPTTKRPTLRASPLLRLLDDDGGGGLDVVDQVDVTLHRSSSRERAEGRADRPGPW